MLLARSCILLSLTLRACHADDVGWQAKDGALTAQLHLAQLKPDGSLAGMAKQPNPNPNPYPDHTSRRLTLTLALALAVALSPTP